jgi:hypothetical protein
MAMVPRRVRHGSTDQGHEVVKGYRPTDYSRVLEADPAYGLCLRSPRRLRRWTVFNRLLHAGRKRRLQTLHVPIS